MGRMRYRAWDGEMIPNVVPISDTEIIENHFWAGPRVRKVKGIMMSTGRLDRDGTEIYQGDFISWDNEIWEVHWERAWLAFTAICKREGRLLLYELTSISYEDDTHPEIQVVGNIYETPDQDLLIEEDHEPSNYHDEIGNAIDENDILKERLQELQLLLDRENDTAIKHASEVERLLSALHGIINIGHNERCLFCGFKDRYAYEELGLELPTSDPDEGDSS